MILDEDDWRHVSQNGKELVLGLLEKKPGKRLGVDDILKHSWMYASKSVNKNAHRCFMKTVAKRKIRRMSMGVFETNSKKLEYIYRHHRKIEQDEESEPTSPASTLSRQNSDFSVYDYSSRASISTSSRRFSRTDDDLFELTLPSMYGYDYDDPNDEMFQRRQSRSIKRKYSQ